MISRSDRKNVYVPVFIRGRSCLKSQQKLLKTINLAKMKKSQSCQFFNHHYKKREEMLQNITHEPEEAGENEWRKKTKDEREEMEN